MKDVVSPLVDSIIGSLNQVIKTYESNFEEIGRLDNETQDLLHEIELSAPRNVCSGYSLYKELRKIRERRRELKDQNEQLSEIYGYCKNKAHIVAELANIQTRSAKLTESQRARKYVAKIRTDLTITNIIKPIEKKESDSARLHKMLKKFRSDVRARSKHKYL
jgi:hypothetical protein